jgi:hypothetical protein
MKKNMGSIDKLIWLAIAAVLVVLYFMNIIGGTLGIVLLVFAEVFVLTSLISFCPLDTSPGFTSGKKDETSNTK